MYSRSEHRKYVLKYAENASIGDDEPIVDFSDITESITTSALDDDIVIPVYSGICFSDLWMRK